MRLQPNWHLQRWDDCVYQRDQDLDNKFWFFLDPSLGQNEKICPLRPGHSWPGSPQKNCVAENAILVNIYLLKGSWMAGVHSDMQRKIQHTAKHLPKPFVKKDCIRERKVVSFPRNSALWPPPGKYNKTDPIRNTEHFEAPVVRVQSGFFHVNAWKSESGKMSGQLHIMTTRHMSSLHSGKETWSCRISIYGEPP